MRIVKKPLAVNRLVGDDSVMLCRATHPLQSQCNSGTNGESPGWVRKSKPSPAVHKAGTPLSYDCNEAFVKTTSVVHQAQPATQPRSGPCSGPEVPNGTSIGRPAFHPLEAVGSACTAICASTAYVGEVNLLVTNSSDFSGSPERPGPGINLFT